MNRPSRAQRIVAIGWVVILWVTWALAMTSDPDLVIGIPTFVFDIAATTWALWPLRRRLVPDRLVDIRDWRGLRAANWELRRRRPWTWGPLRTLWIYPIHLLVYPTGATGTYYWKSRAERRLLKSLGQCCGVPDGQRCSMHGGSDDVAR